ncbi:hypothetical protein PGT21_036786 [Puccinia graminis f. sp. tritici]|uniref:Uncharacterized protein n=1 Tax=Puccinia graminis f. sp. tritici TaxID=56615 RepID=A0A5B0PMP1_PUCGR|nr:hypothetical protein PGT21_036786 [Puccinia graminis f. sp. tritici]
MVVAMLSIARAISQYGGPNQPKPTKGLRNNLNIINLAPMKALAVETVRDMQLTRHEINATYLIVTTPEKWDVVTRKSSGEEGLVSSDWLGKLSCLKWLGLEPVDLTEIGSLLVQQSLSVDQLARLRSYLKENSRKTIRKIVEQLTLSTEETLITRTKEFYAKLPRVLMDQNALFLEETTSTSPDRQPTVENGCASAQFDNH